MTHPNDPSPLRTYYWMITATWRGNHPQTASGTVDAYADDTYEDLASSALLSYANKTNAPADMAVVMFHLTPNNLACTRVSEGPPAFCWRFFLVLEAPVLGTFFVLLYAAHHLSDYPFQTDHQAARKADRTLAGWTANLVHSGTHVLTAAVLLAAAVWLLPDLHVTAIGCTVALGWLGISHSIIDRRWLIRWWMEHTGQRGYLQHGGALTVDQAAHIGLGLLPAAFILTAA